MNNESRYYFEAVQELWEDGYTISEIYERLLSVFDSNITLENVCDCVGVDYEEYIADINEYDEDEEYYSGDSDADAYAIASAGWGTDEDYGGFSDIDEY